jgi:hypothetical protein
MFNEEMMMRRTPSPELTLDVEAVSHILDQNHSCKNLLPNPKIPKFDQFTDNF